jgi:hypothetical protein
MSHPSVRLDRVRETRFVRPPATMPTRRSPTPTGDYRVDGWIENYRRPLEASLPELIRERAAAERLVIAWIGLVVSLASATLTLLESI